MNIKVRKIVYALTRKAIKLIQNIVLTLNHGPSNVRDNHNHLIGNIIPSPDTLMVRIIGLDEWVVRHTHICKVPFILGSCFVAKKSEGMYSS